MAGTGRRPLPSSCLDLIRPSPPFRTTLGEMPGHPRVKPGGRCQAMTRMERRGAPAPGNQASPSAFRVHCTAGRAFIRA